MKTGSVALNDSQIAMFTERGTAFSLILMQEETTDDTGQIIAPAKSFTILRREAALALRDLLNKALGEGEHEQPCID